MIAYSAIWLDYTHGCSGTNLYIGLIPDPPLCARVWLCQNNSWHSPAWPDPIPHRGKGLGHGHRAVCCPAPWSVYQSQHSIQSHDTWSMWLMGKFKISVWVEHELEAWEVRWTRSILSYELEHSRNRNHECRNVASLTSVNAIVTSWLDLHN